ncbi:MAG TPA: BON domain-containing protein [Gemmatimonadales bacterium]|nr:BON domain-containing protein [Gemmatimonadales bacterium]
MMAPHSTRVGRDGQEPGLLGIALAAAAGFAVGLAAGMVTGELLGNVNAQRMRHMVRRWGGEPAHPRTPDEIERAVTAALADAPDTKGLHIRARAIDDGLVELTGRAPNEDVRLKAGEIARRATGGDVVVNRILVKEGARAT